MVLIRYVLPAVIFIGGIWMLVSGSSAGLEGFFMAIGAALSVIFMNVLFRMGAKGDREREREAQAREYYARHGHWPGEPPRR